MSNSILYVGIDVDDKSFHGAGFCQETGEMLEFRCRASNSKLIEKLGKLKKQGFQLRTCYEASYIGFSLHRFLVSKGVDNTVVAPSMIPEQPGARIKTDRIDSRKLAEYFAKDLLTPIHVPDEGDEQVRDFIRTRRYFVDQMKSLKNHIVSLLKRHGFHYNEDGGNKSYWTDTHLNWIRQKTKALGGTGKTNLEMLLEEYERADANIDRYDDEIEKLAEMERYKKSQEALCCFRGIDTLSAMSLVTELGDVKRFPHPSKLISYVGLGISEYSSGGKEKKFGITKMGNWRVRTTIVESSQFAGRSFRISKRLKKARQGQPREVVAIADKCMHRLRKKSLRLREKGKHTNKIKTACAREHLCFVWEALMAVA